MPTDIMKSADLVILAANEKDWKAGNVKRLICARLAKLGAVGNIQPCLGQKVSEASRLWY